MATTYYETINGEILGEQTGGVYTGYMRDALGSVTGTTDSSGNLENTYRWAGYGTQISKSGTANDPKFLWNGIWGYRQTGRAHTGVYVRRRHYGWEQAAWTSVDALWPRMAAFRYAGGAPATARDPSGESAAIGRIQVQPKIASTPVCGNGCSTLWQFVVGPYVGDPPTGWLIQRITNQVSVTCCALENAKTQKPVACFGFYSTYYEAWMVKGGGVWNPQVANGGGCATPLAWAAVGDDPNAPCDNCNDIWGFPGHADCSFGNQKKTGDIMFLPGSTDSLPAGFAVNSSSCAGCLPMSFSFSKFSPESGGTGTLTSQWGCCGGDQKVPAKCKACPSGGACMPNEVCEASP